MELIFKIFVIFTAFQRVIELFISKRNERYIKSIGGLILKENNYIFMVILHSSWIITLLYYAFFTTLTTNSLYFITFSILFIIGQCLRIMAITTLKKKWSTRVMILPDAPVITSGLFNYIRHPNYLGVVIELAALPLMASLWEVAITFSLINAIILFFRIRFEEDMLIKYNNYREKFFDRKHV